jgi:hypothetical protein
VLRLKAQSSSSPSRSNVSNSTFGDGAAGGVTDPFAPLTARGRRAVFARAHRFVAPLLVVAIAAGNRAPPQQQLDRVVRLLDCGICLGLLRRPVTLPCGHNYCLRCLRQLVAYTAGPRFACPMDRHTFPKTFPLFVSVTLQGILASLGHTTDGEQQPGAVTGEDGSDDDATLPVDGDDNDDDAAGATAGATRV